MQKATVQQPGITMEVLLYLHGGVGVVFCEEDKGYIGNPANVVKVVQRQHVRKYGSV